MPYNNGDLVYLAKGESSHMCEIIVQVKEQNDNFLICTQMLTIHKMMQQNGDVSYQGMVGGGLISNRSVLTQEQSGDLIINLNNFDVCGLVTNKDIVDQFHKQTSKLVTAPNLTAAKKGVVA